MRRDTEQTGRLGNQAGPRRANRRLNGKAETAGIPDPPTRTRLARTFALVKAALRAWETNQPRCTSVWRQGSR